jgi:nitroreductase
MQFDDVIQNRRSIRKYKQDEVSDAQITDLLNAARLAPSGLNIQPWRFVVVKDAEARSRLAAETASPFAASAPVLLLCCADKAAFAAVGTRIQELQTASAISDTALKQFASGELFQSSQANDQWLRASLTMYTAIAITHILLKATDLGLGSCWIGKFNEEKAAAIAGLDERYIVAAIVTIGYAEQQPQPRPRLPLENLLLKVI